MTWEEKTAVWLASHLTHGVLAKLLGPLLDLLRRERRALTGSGRPFTRRELATAFVHRHGRDLLCDPKVRKAVARTAGVSTPKRWQSGKPAALKFVADAGLPRELAGIAAEKSAPNVEVLQGRFRLPPLLGFQRETKAELDRTLRSPGDRAMLTLPTGAGKTRIAVESIRDWFEERSKTTDHGDICNVLWLAHTAELCEQVCLCFKQVWDASENVEPLRLVRSWGEHAQDLARTRRTLEVTRGRPCVLVSTPQRIVKLLANSSEVAAEVLQELACSLGAVVVDEAHREPPLHTGGSSRP